MEKKLREAEISRKKMESFYELQIKRLTEENPEMEKEEKMMVFFLRKLKFI